MAASIQRLDPGANGRSLPCAASHRGRSRSFRKVRGRAGGAAAHGRAGGGKMEEVLLRRAANALFADVEPARPLTKGPVGWLLGGPLAWFKRIAGGLWVGGTVTITTGHVQFEPNAMN